MQHSTLTPFLVDSSDIPDHVQPILPDGKSHPEALPVTKSLLLLADWQVCAANQPQELV